jgi:hypothetical protein
MLGNQCNECYLFTNELKLKRAAVILSALDLCRILLTLLIFAGHLF